MKVLSVVMFSRVPCMCAKRKSFRPERQWQHGNMSLCSLPGPHRVKRQETSEKGPVQSRHIGRKATHSPGTLWVSLPPLAANPGNRSVTRGGVSCPPPFSVLGFLTSVCHRWNTRLF